MELIVAVKLQPEPLVVDALHATLQTCNDVATDMSRVSFDRGVWDRHQLQPIVYTVGKDAGLGAQPTILCVRKVADAYKTLRSNIRNGNLGKVGSRRRVLAESKPVVFRPDAAQPFDDRCLSWQYDDGSDASGGTVSIWTMHGRMKQVRFVCSPTQLATLRQFRKGQTDLVVRDGVFYLHATVTVPTEALRLNAARLDTINGWVGIDLGIVNIATTSTGRRFSGRRINHYRRKAARQRAGLQAKGTKSARRKLKKIARKEARFARDVNHRISKTMVMEAKRTDRGIARENLTGIRDRARQRRPRRITTPPPTSVTASTAVLLSGFRPDTRRFHTDPVTGRRLWNRTVNPTWGTTALHSWAFAQLGAFIDYKAERAGVPVCDVDPRHTSQECSRCHHIDPANRNAGVFHCLNCGHVAPADTNAAHVMPSRATREWRAAINQPPKQQPLLRKDQESRVHPPHPVGATPTNPRPSGPGS